MKKLIKICLLIVVLVVLFQFRVAILKPFSEPCGYGGTSMQSVVCECDGFSFKEVKVGSTDYYCLGECSSCECEKDSDSVPCEELSHLDWAFPL